MTRTVALLLVASAVALAAPVPKGKKSPMPTEVGTKWVYIRGGDEDVTGTEEITESTEKDGVKTVTVTVKITGEEGTQFEKFEIKDGAVALIDSTFGQFDPPLVLWKAGLKDGDSWEVKYTLAGTEFEGTYTAGKAEELTTPAGKFTCVPITRRYTKPDDYPESVYWHADGVGLVKQMSAGRVDQELKSFAEGKGKEKK